MSYQRMYFPNTTVETSKGTLEVTTGGTCYLQTDRGKIKLDSLKSDRHAIVHVDLLGTPMTVMSKHGKVTAKEWAWQL